MRRLTMISSLVLSTLALSATAAWAEPTHGEVSFSGTFSAPAGQLCDFAYYQTFTIDDRFIAFGDPNNPTKSLDHFTEYVTHTNLDTGYTLSELDHLTVAFDASNSRFKQVGLFFHLRDATGNLVLVEAGQALFDTNTGELLKVTPNVTPDFAAVICPALGGQPAI
jgi:type 1 fimbria pilin